MHEHALQAGVELLRHRGVPAVAPFNALLAELLTLDPADFAEAAAHIEDEGERQTVVEALRWDFHAGFFETSMALHYAPGSVDPRYRELPPCPPATPARGFELASKAARAAGATRTADELAYLSQAVGWLSLRPFPGYTSHPAHAAASAGAWCAAQLVERFTPIVAEVLAGRAPSPPPIVPWLPLVSVGGLVGPPHVPAAAMLRVFA